MTHFELVKRAARWLRNTRGCSIVITTANNLCDEQPDAIGFGVRGLSIVLEGKVSRADFLRDQKKSFRQFSELGMGHERYYFVTPGVVNSLSELPSGWGLLECKTAVVSVRQRSASFPGKNKDAELRLVLAALRKCAWVELLSAEVEDGCLLDVAL